jgi:iron complex outermembrane receptor protein
MEPNASWNMGEALLRSVRGRLPRILVTLFAAVLTAAARGQSSESRPASQPAAPPSTEESSAGASAEETLEDLELLSLDIPTVITATRREQKISTLPYAVSVITKEDIRQSGARSVPDALRLAPGVDVAETSSAIAAVAPRGLHGLSAREVLVLVDGRQIFDSVFGGTLWGDWPFQLEDIERIEVIRGPGGVTWGANAVNGVINIITKDPADQLGLTVTGGGGSRGNHKEHLGYAFQEGKLRMRVSGEYEAHDGFKGDSLFGPVDDYFKVGRMNVHAIYDAGPHDTLTLSGGSNVEDGAFPLTPLMRLTGRTRPDTQSNYVLGKWEHTVAPDNRFKITGYVNDFRLDAGSPAIQYQYQQFALQFGHTFTPAENHTLTWGVDSRTDLVDTTNADPFFLSQGFVSSAIIGAYVQDEWRFAPRWTFSLGGRIDYEFYGGSEPSARASLAYQLSDDAMIYGAVSRAFQMFPASARFMDVPFAGGLAYMTANADMGAEHLMAYELGYQARLFDRLHAHLSAFWHEYDDLTSFHLRPGPPGLARIAVDNGFTASTYGAEADLRYLVNKRLSLLGHYTFELQETRGLSPFNFNDYLAAPKHKFMLGARYSPTDDLHLAGHLYYVDASAGPDPTTGLLRRSIHPYFRLDLRAEQEFWDDRASLAVGVRNLLDPSHLEGTSLFQPEAEVPRMVYAEMRIRLGE